MKIIAAKRIGRNGREFKPGDVLDVSPAHARMYVASRQATWPRASDAPVHRDMRAAEVPAEAEAEHASSSAAVPSRRGRYRRRDMTAEGDKE